MNPSNMILIPEGEFLFGTDRNEYGDARKLEKTQDFYIDKYPVTNKEYKKFLSANPSVPVPYVDAPWAIRYNWDKKLRAYPKGLGNHPAVMVQHDHILHYCKWAKKQLPTETEWEKAARGTKGNLYPWGNSWFAQRANTSNSGLNGTSPVTQFSIFASPFGVVDLIGNVWEWTITSYEYGGYVIRGGSWQMESKLVNCCSRSGATTAYKSSALGWRGVRYE